MACFCTKIDVYRKTETAKIHYLTHFYRFSKNKVKNYRCIWEAWFEDLKIKWTEGFVSVKDISLLYVSVISVISIKSKPILLKLANWEHIERYKLVL